MSNIFINIILYSKKKYSKEINKVVNIKSILIFIGISLLIKKESF